MLVEPTLQSNLVADAEKRWEWVRSVSFAASTHKRKKLLTALVPLMAWQSSKGRL